MTSFHKTLTTRFPNVLSIFSASQNLTDRVSKNLGYFLGFHIDFILCRDQHIPRKQHDRAGKGGGLRETEKYKETKIQRDAQIQRDTKIQRDKQIQRHIQTHKKSSQSIKKLYTENNMAEEGGKRLDETDQYKVKYRETHKYNYR